MKRFKDLKEIKDISSDNGPNAGRFSSGPAKSVVKPAPHVSPGAPVVEDEDPCWKGYQQIGMKDKNGKKVPNCVPVKEQDDDKFSRYMPEDGWSKTGKEATHRETGEKTYEYKKVDKDGKETGERHYRNAQGKHMGEAFDMNEEESDTSEKTEMAQTQLHFIKYAAEEILEYIEMGGEIEEWYQNKLSKVQSEVESLHSYVEGESRRTGMKEEFMSEQKPPFDGPYTKTKGTVTDKSGAKHSPMSRARDLARDAMKKTMSAPKKKSVSESRQASIVREAAKDAKEKAKTKDDKKSGTKDKFEAEPELTSQIVTTNNQ
jgi:hypothetical protein